MTMSLWGCTTCSKSFTRKGDLNRHQLLHTGIKPHACATCGRRFAQRSGLNTHTNIHTKRKPHICGVGTCKKAFGDPSSCARHRKEFHSREGAFKCFVADCGTKIKRRSAFVAHLRKHGLDTESIDVDAVSQNSGDSTPAQSASPSIENVDYNAQSRSISPSFIGDNSGYHIAANSNEASYQWPEGQPYDCRRVNLTAPNNTFLLPPDQTIDIGSDIPCDVFSYAPGSNVEDPFFLNSIFSTVIDYPYLPTPSSHLPLFEPFLDNGYVSYGSQSSSSSPSSTYSTLY